MKKPEYKTLTIEAAKAGWIVKEKNKPAEIFIFWNHLINKLEKELTTKMAEEKND